MDIAGLNLLTLFAIIGGIGFVFLIISLVVGDIFDALGFDTSVGDSGSEFGFFDSRVLAVFVTAFGGFGAIGTQMGFGAAASSGIGLLGGVVFGAIVSLFGRFLIGQQASSTITDTDLLGKTAQVTVAIRGGQLGQITARIGEERIERLARAEGNAEIGAGSLVKVKAIAGDSLIVVLDEEGNRGLSS